MELKITNAQLIGLNEGCHELLEVEDLETMFSFRVSTILEVLLPKLKAFEKTRKGLAKRYLTIETMGEDGAVTGKRCKNEEVAEYNEKLQVLVDAGVKLNVPTVRMTAIHKMREEEGLPILSSTIHKIRPIVRMDMELPDDDEPGHIEAVEPQNPKKKKKTRAERLKNEDSRSGASTLART